MKNFFRTFYVVAFFSLFLFSCNDPNDDPKPLDVSGAESTTGDDDDDVDGTKGEVLGD